MLLSKGSWHYNLYSYKLILNQRIDLGVLLCSKYSQASKTPYNWNPSVISQNIYS